MVQIADDGTNFVSYVDFAYQISEYEEWVLAEITGVTAADSGDVDWSVRVGKNAQAAFDASTTVPFDSGSWNDAGLNYPSNPRARGGGWVVRISNGENGVAWAFEGGTLAFDPGGKRRR